MPSIPIPQEEIISGHGQEFWTPRRVARTAIFIAMSAVGAMIKVPSPTGTVALDAAFAFFSAITFGWKEGMLVAALGHLLTALTTGFPLGFPMHILIAVEMGLWVSIFSLLARKVHLWAGIIAGIILNGPVSAVMVIPIGGMGLMAALLIPLTIGGAVNIFIAVTAYLIIKKSSMI
ncbi:MAG: ECF transporter S component [Ignavibacteriales bacterium]